MLLYLIHILYATQQMYLRPYLFQRVSMLLALD